MGAFEDLTGRVYGRLTVLRRAPKTGHATRWECRCECGTERSVQASNLKTGHTASCGCAHKRDGKRKHGMTRTPTYRSWVAMRRRCNDTKYQEWHLYGGRGITVCDRWENSFEAFLEDMGVRPNGQTLDREDTNGNYEPGNCRWATVSDQAKNTRSSLVRGKNLPELCAEAGVNIHTVTTRMKRQGMSLQEALTAPYSRGRPRHANRG